MDKGSNKVNERHRSPLPPLPRRRFSNSAASHREKVEEIYKRTRRTRSRSQSPTSRCTTTTSTVQTSRCTTTTSTDHHLDLDKKRDEQLAIRREFLKHQLQEMLSQGRWHPAKVESASTSSASTSKAAHMNDKPQELNKNDSAANEHQDQKDLVVCERVSLESDEGSDPDNKIGPNMIERKTTMHKVKKLKTAEHKVEQA